MIEYEEKETYIANQAEYWIVMDSKSCGLRKVEIGPAILASLFGKTNP
jgi:hypothetical protein